MNPFSNTYNTLSDPCYTFTDISAGSMVMKSKESSRILLALVYLKKQVFDPWHSESSQAVSDSVEMEKCRCSSIKF